MYLKELEIFGFKSFPEKATLKFEPGITVIVGPNGCGKSNVLDAVKWALGEQSPKSLRGSKMEDIIFNGTEHHPALSYAEVTLNFSNEDKYLPIEYKEVSIARRLYRSGESQYFINKSPVRLKDIQDLLMGTGIGEATYSFVEQGKIEIFLSYKPEDKRLIFDEASGIVKYKDRRKETLKRLKETEENLLRLDDILSEVGRQIRYLQRQVDKASKYKELQAELVEVEKKIASLQFADLEEKTNKALEELNSFKEKERDKDGQLKEARDKWEALNSKLKNLRKDLEDTNALVVSLGAQIESATSHINVYQQRIKELEERNDTIEQTRINLKERLNLQEQRANEEWQRLSAIEENINKANQEVGALKEEKDELKQILGQTREKVEDEKINILELESKKTDFHNSLIEIQTTLSSLANRKKRLLLDKARLDGFSKEKRDNLEIAQKELETMEGQLSLLKEKKNSLAAKEKEVKSCEEDLKNELIDKEKELVELNACYEFLKDLRIKYETFSAKKKVTVIFKEEPKDINKIIASLKGATFYKEGNSYKTELEAKVVSLEEGQLEERITSFKNELEKIRISLGDLNNQAKHLNEEVILESNQIEEKDRSYREKLQEKENLSRECQRFSEEFDLVEEELSNIMREIDSFENKQKEKEEEINVCENNLASAQEVLRKNQDSISNNAARVQEIDIEAARKETQKQAIYKEKEALNSKIDLLVEEKNNIIRNIDELEKEKENNELRSSSLSTKIEELNSTIESDRIEIKEKEQKKQTQEKEEEIFSKQIDENNELIQIVEKESEQIKASIYNKKLEVQSLDYEKQKIKDYLKQVYSITFDTLPAEDITQSPDMLSGNREKLQEKMQSLGEVNLVAIEEFEELKKRQDFLEKQKEDLITSKDNLKKAIQKINRISKELFLETFAKIQEEFKKNFRFLFNGGRANLILLDEEDILESGVDIEVQPPGKKLQNVSLLSGGEKALTAISLIFAIFRVRPSPLCVLDEIDAPLDEANVDRFNIILKEFSSFSQFILITHNKKTMGSANVLYGVTIQEKGVSKLVSVKFASEEVPS